MFFVLHFVAFDLIGIKIPRKFIDCALPLNLRPFARLVKFNVAYLKGKKLTFFPKLLLFLLSLIAISFFSLLAG